MSPQKKQRKATPHSLEGAARRELDIELDKEHQSADWGGELTPAMVEYAAKDAKVLLPLAETLENKVTEGGLAKVAEIERRALPAMVWMENAGILFDSAGWKGYLRQVEDDIEKLKDELAELAPDRPGGGEWNWNSHQQIKQVFALEGVELEDTKADTLTQYDHPLAKLLLEYKKATKMLSHFGSKLLGAVQEDSRIYASWRQIRAETGRMSCSSPNLQQLPPEVRGYVRAPEGRVLVWADYAQAKIRILASASGDSTLIEAFRAGKDPYKATAAAMFQIPEYEVADEQRAAAKVVNFSFIFGASAHGIARKLGTTEVEGERLMQRYFAAHPDVASFLKRTTRKALRTGEARTLTGRLRWFGNVLALSLKEKRAVKREAMNHPMQGSCADGLKLALALLYERRHECPGAVPIIALHDELVVECDEEDVEAVALWLEKAMIDGMSEVLALGASGVNLVPVEVEVKIGKTWGDDLSLSPPASEDAEGEELAMAAHLDHEPANVELYIDYRDPGADNYPQIALCDECADELGAKVEELDTLEPGEEAACERCGRRNAAALGSLE